MTEAVKIYFDSCCFIDMVKYQRNSDLIREPGRKQDIWFMGRLCDACLAGDIEIYTSTLTIAECLHGGDGVIDEEVQELFIKFLTSGRVVTTISADQFVAEYARDLRWVHGINLKGADGIHIASSMILNCAEFITTDAKITNEVSKFGRAIEALHGAGVKVVRASETQYLPDKYRQDTLVEE
ncbi:MAG: PIN domain-containing protein [Proteobacteria bacterium]|nr:PIN domain-containing protein [Pseudomonadota bacterium]